MRHYEKGRSRKQQRIDREAIHEIDEEHVDSKARERFLRKPYTNYTVRDCLKKWGVDVKGDVASGQESPK